MSHVIVDRAEKMAPVILTAGEKVPVHRTKPHAAMALFGSPDKTEFLLSSAVGARGSTNRTTINIPTSIHWLGTMWLNVSLAAPTSATNVNRYFPYAGLGLVRSATLRCGANVIGEMADANAVIKAMIRSKHPSQGEAILTAVNGASVGSSPAANTAIKVAVPLVFGFGAWAAGPSGEVGQALPTHKLGADRQLTLEIEWNDANVYVDQATGGAETGTNTNYISRADLVCMHFRYHASARLDDPSPVGVYGSDFVSAPSAYVTGASGVPATAGFSGGYDQSLLNLAAMNAEALFIFHTTGTTGFVGAALADFATSDLTVGSMSIEGQRFWSTSQPSQAQQALEAAALGFGRCEIDAAAANTEQSIIIPLSTVPGAVDAYTGGLVSSALQNWTVSLTSASTMKAYQIVAKASCYILIENGEFIRKRV